MARARTVAVTIEDVDGSFKRFIREAPKVARELLKDAVAKTTVGVAQSMKAGAPVGPDAPHIKDAIDYTLPKRGLTGRAGILEERAHDPAFPGATGEGSTLAHVALYQEYGTDRHGKQAFMLPAALNETRLFKQRAIAALKQVERDLSAGGLT